MKISFDSDKERNDWIFGLIKRLHASGWVCSLGEKDGFPEGDDGVNEQYYEISKYIEEMRIPESPA